jgi:hypothetical protein
VSGAVAVHDSQDSYLGGIAEGVNWAGKNVQTFALLAFKVLRFQKIHDENCLIISYLSNMLSCTLGQIIAHTPMGLPEKSK